MLVSWKWLQDYVSLDMDREAMEERLAMAGLNHEGTKPLADDFCIDLEVTSNRADCLGHIGVAREIAVLYQTELKIPAADVVAQGPPVEGITKVRIDCPELCYRYTARVIRGVKIGPSPDWLKQRLDSIGIASVNNVVDVTNLVMMESGQPLHAFDLSLLAGPEIVVRAGQAKEKFEAIDHRAYTLDAGMCVIADAERGVALGGVMGGARTEVSEATTDLLIEAAEFAPLVIRNTARKLRLHSPSSYRFERGVDPVGVDWASRRCCQLILKVAGGVLAEGVIDAGNPPLQRDAIELRWEQVPRVLGITVSKDEIRQILSALGNEETSVTESAISVVPPSWRRDLTREIDLIEEIARIHGYEKIPEDVGVPMVPSHRHDWERIEQRVRTLLTGLGFDEALTASVVPSEWLEAFSPWTERLPLTTETAMLEGANQLRSSLVPSLLRARRNNEVVANATIELFETARIYLPGEDGQPHEQATLAISSGQDYFHLKGVLEALLDALNPAAQLEVRPNQQNAFRASASGELFVDNQLWGFIGSLTEAARDGFGLRDATSVAEVRMSLLTDVAELIPQHRDLSLFPSMSRDLNIVLDEQVSWAEVEETVRGSAGSLLEEVTFREIYRNYDRDGDGKKRMLFTVFLRSHEATLSGQQADHVHQQVVQAIEQRHGGRLLAG